MDSSHLTSRQAEQLGATLRRQLTYLNKLCGRLQLLRFPLDDPLCREALRARDAIQALYDATAAAGHGNLPLRGKG